MKNIFTEDWELRCETQLPDPNRPRAYICSPLRDPSKDGVLKNMRRAKAYMFYAMEVLGYTAFAPHAFLPAFLDDEIEQDRALALQFGLQVLKRCDELFVCGNSISPGMEGEIAEAAKRDITIRVFNPSLLQNARNIVAGAAGDIRKVALNQCHPPMASENPITSHIRFINDLTQYEKGLQHALSV